MKRINNSIKKKVFNLKHEKSRIAWIISTAVSIIIIGIGLFVEEYTFIVKNVGFILLGLSYLQVYILCRCPYCSHSFLTISGICDIRLVVEIPKYCPKCGKEVN